VSWLQLEVGHRFNTTLYPNPARKEVS
jgi:hypothetical protein